MLILRTTHSVNLLKNFAFDSCQQINNALQLSICCFEFRAIFLNKVTTNPLFFLNFQR